MEEDFAIRAQGLGKKYVIGHQVQRERYTALRDVIVRNARSLARSAADIFRGRAIASGDELEEYWALKDLQFDIGRGDVVGVIGRNGAGKSTLLKILSRITEPSEGRVEIRGRVASLLEVGTGFHPELSGRENIYLNGAVLGMTREETRSKFDEIVAFAEVERFLDTPVKRYSSGMYVRLAFAVAAHLEPEILIVDEVLAVGDAEFQRKCLGKMGEVAGQGRTVLFVSHNMAAVESLTTKAILLKAGQLTAYGATRDVVESYLTGGAGSSEKVLGRRRGKTDQPGAEILDFEVFDSAEGVSEIIRPGRPITLKFVIRSTTLSPLEVAFAIENAGGAPLFASHLSDKIALPGAIGEFEATAQLSVNHLRQGQYAISFGVYSPDFFSVYDEILHHHAFNIEGHDDAFPNDRRWGDFAFPISWNVETVTRAASGLVIDVQAEQR